MIITDEQLREAVEKMDNPRIRELAMVDGTCSPWNQALYQGLVIRLAHDPPIRGDVPIDEAAATPAARRYGLTGPPPPDPPRCGCRRGGSCAPRGAA